MAEDLGADSVGERRRTFDERKGAVQMKEGAKLLVLAALAVLAAAIHRREKARLGRSWAGYGAHLLGWIWLVLEGRHIWTSFVFWRHFW